MRVSSTAPAVPMANSTINSTLQRPVRDMISPASTALTTAASTSGTVTGPVKNAVPEPWKNGQMSGPKPSRVVPSRNIKTSATI